MSARFILLALAVCVASNGCSVGSYTRYSAEYPNMMFIGTSPSSFIILITGAQDAKIAPIYVRYQGRVYFLPNLPPQFQDIFFENGFIGTDFEKGRLTYLLAKPKGGLEFSGRQEGPFYRLPISEKELTAVFGKPTMKKERVSQPLH